MTDPQGGEGKVKISNVLLNLSLHLGTLPPDSYDQPTGLPSLECWIQSDATSKSGEAISQRLLLNYENIQPKAKYKSLLDPQIDDLRKHLASLRKHAKDDRVIYHFIGHGVPKPTAKGELWSFNRQYTQYLPLSIHEIHKLVGVPSFYILDTSAGGNVTEHLKQITEVRKGEKQAFPVIYFASTEEGSESLPLGKDCPRDLFTSCLISPVEASVYHYALRRMAGTSQFGKDYALDAVRKVTGKLGERRSPLGLLNWIFTCLMDSIAWDCVDRDLFRVLFRQDLLLSSLFRNFLLATWVMRSYGVAPVSYPAIERDKIFTHSLWNDWDSILEQFLFAVDQNSPQSFVERCSFFDDRLLAIERLASTPRESTSLLIKSYPCLLQNILSQAHRQPALELLLRLFKESSLFIEESMHLGVFPYLLKVVHTCSVETKVIIAQLLIPILQAHPEAKADLLRERTQSCFLKLIYESSSVEDILPLVRLISILCKDCPAAADACIDSKLCSFIFSLCDKEDFQHIAYQALAVVVQSSYPTRRKSFHFIAKGLSSEDQNIRLSAALLLKGYLAKSVEGGRPSDCYLDSVILVSLDACQCVRLAAIRILAVISNQFLEKLQTRIACVREFEVVSCLDVVIYCLYILKSDYCDAVSKGACLILTGIQTAATIAPKDLPAGSSDWYAIGKEPFRPRRQSPSDLRCFTVDAVAEFSFVASHPWDCYFIAIDKSGFLWKGEREAIQRVGPLPVPVERVSDALLFWDDSFVIFTRDSFLLFFRDFALESSVRVNVYGLLNAQLMKFKNLLFIQSKTAGVIFDLAKMRVGKVFTDDHLVAFSFYDEHFYVLAGRAREISKFSPDFLLIEKTPLSVPKEVSVSKFFKRENFYFIGSCPGGAFLSDENFNFLLKEQGRILCYDDLVVACGGSLVRFFRSLDFPAQVQEFPVEGEIYLAQSFANRCEFIFFSRERIYFFR